MPAYREPRQDLFRNAARAGEIDRGRRREITEHAEQTAAFQFN